VGARGAVAPSGPRAPHDLQLLRDGREARPVYIRAALRLRGSASGVRDAWLPIGVVPAAA